MRLDAVVCRHLPEHSRARVQEWIHAGRVLVDGQTTKPSFLVKGGETIQVDPAPQTPLKAEAEDIPLNDFV